MPFPLPNTALTTTAIRAFDPPEQIMLQADRTWTFTPGDLSQSAFPSSLRSAPVKRPYDAAIGLVRLTATRVWNGLGGLVTVYEPLPEVGASIPRAGVPGLVANIRGRTSFQRGR